MIPNRQDYAVCVNPYGQKWPRGVFEHFLQTIFLTSKLTKINFNYLIYVVFKLFKNQSSFVACVDKNSCAQQQQYTIFLDSVFSVAAQFGIRN